MNRRAKRVALLCLILMVGEYAFFGTGRLVFAIRGRLHGAHMDDTFRFAYAVIAVLAFASMIFTAVVVVRQSGNVAATKIMLFVAVVCHTGGLFARGLMRGESGCWLHPLDIALGTSVIIILLALRIYTKVKSQEA